VGAVAVAAYGYLWSEVLAADMFASVGPSAPLAEGEDEGEVLEPGPVALGAADAVAHEGVAVGARVTTPRSWRFRRTFAMLRRHAYEREVGCRTRFAS
jgi:hypothetical protein